MAFSRYLGTDRNALLLCQNDRRTSSPFFLDLNAPEFLSSCICVFPGAPGMFFPPSAPARGSLVWMCFSSSKSREADWDGLGSVGSSFQTPGALECAVPGSPLWFWDPDGSWHTPMQSAEPAHRVYWHREYIGTGSAGFGQRSSPWCCAEPPSCSLLVLCSVSLGHLCSLTTP